MKLLLYLLIGAVFLCSQGCLLNSVRKNKKVTAIVQPLNVTDKIIDDDNTELSDYHEGPLLFIQKIHLEILLILLLLLLLVRHRRYVKKKNINLDENDIALIGVASDALNDLQYRLKKKSKVRVLPLSKCKNEDSFNPNDSSIINN